MHAASVSSASRDRRSGREPGDSVAGVRRFAAMLVLVGAVVVFDAGPATAHICTYALQIPVGQPHTIQVAVTVEGFTVPDVEMTLPPGLQLNQVDALPGWTVSHSGSTVRFRGGPIAPYTCQYFSMTVTAPTAGQYGINVVQRDESGKVVARSIVDPSQPLDPYQQQVVYAGVTPPKAPGQAGGTSTTTIVGIVLVAVAALFIGGLLFRSWRARRYEAELEARVEAFKRRAHEPH